MLTTAALAIALLAPQGPTLAETASKPFGEFKAVRSRIKNARATKDRHEQDLWLSPARIVSPDQRSIGSVQHADDVDHIWINDKKVAGYARVYTLWVGNEVGSYAAIVHDGGADAIVVNGEKKAWLDRIDAIWMDDSGKHVAARGQKDGKNTIAVDGKPFALPDAMVERMFRRKNPKARSTIETYVLPTRARQHFQFSPDGKRWVALIDCETYVQPFVDGKPGPKFASIHSATFSPDGKRLACLGTIKKGRSLTGNIWLDGKATRIAYGAKAFTFSPDGARIAYHGAVPGKRKPAKRGKKPPLVYPGARIVVDDYRSGAFDAATPIAFSADSKRWAVMVRKGNKVSVIIDGTVKAAGTTPKKNNSVFLAAPVFSPDGTRIAYRRYKDGKVTCDVTGLADGLPHGWHKSVDDVRFSPDGKRVAVTTSDGKNHSIFVDGKLHRTVPVRRTRGALGAGLSTLYLGPDIRTRSLSIGWTSDSRHLIEIRNLGAYFEIKVGGTEVATRLVLFTPEMTSGADGKLQFWGGNEDGGFVRLDVLPTKGG